LIPPEYDAQLATLKSKQAVVEFAEQLGIHPRLCAMVMRVVFDTNK